MEKLKKGYKFRVCFKLANDGTFTGEEKSLEFPVNQLGGILKLTAIGNKEKFNSSNRYHIVGESYKTEKEARASAKKVKIAVLHYAITERMRIDLGNYALLDGFKLSKYGREMYSQQFGAPVQEDYLGITIFEAELMPKFINVSFKGVVGKSIDTFVNKLQQNCGRYTFESTQVTLAAELYSMSHVENTSRVKFLTLVMCLEVMIKPFSRSEEIRSHVSSLIDATKALEVPSEDKNSLLTALSGLKWESISQRGRKMALDLLGDKKYFSLIPEQFFTKIYNIRSSLVHQGKVDPRELQNMLGDVDQFVSDILHAQFIEREPPVKN